MICFPVIKRRVELSVKYRMLLTYHDDRQLLCELHQTASIVTLKLTSAEELEHSVYLFIPQEAKDVIVLSRMSHKLPFEEPDVDDGRVKIYKLKNENFEGQIIIICRLRSVHF